MPTVIKSIPMIFSGKTLLVRLLDGALRQCRVRALPARRLGQVLNLCTNEAALIELCTQAVEDTAEIGAIQPSYADVPEGWADNLTDESHIELYQAAKELNFTRAADWGKRQIAAKQFQAPLLLEANTALEPYLREMIHLALSSLPPSALQAAASTKS
jgi:hypothetical protein